MKWFTSDQHFGHKNIIDFCNRPFRDVNEMNGRLVHNWNSVVGTGDEVYVLGDFAMGNVEETLLNARSLHGQLFLVPGNHDRCWTGWGKHRKGYGPEWVEKYEQVGFTVLPDTHVLEIADVAVELCHFPFVGDSRSDDRFSGSRPADVGQLLLHGHVHDSWRTNDRMFNVGVDVNGYYPVSEETIIEWVESCERTAHVQLLDRLADQ